MAASCCCVSHLKAIFLSASVQKTQPRIELLRSEHDLGVYSHTVPMEADGGYESADEGMEGIQGVQPEKMSIGQLKNWLTEQGHEDQVWKLAQSRAKKPQYVAAARAVLGA